MNPDELKTMLDQATAAYRHGSYARRIPQYNAIKENEMNNTKNITDQNTAVLSVKAGKFIIGSFTDQAGMSFSAQPTAHDTAIEARTECKRLAKLYPGKLFVFVKLTGAELLPVLTTVSI